MKPKLESAHAKAKPKLESAYAKAKPLAPAMNKTVKTMPYAKPLGMMKKRIAKPKFPK
jgi:hypothetical protein